VPREGEPLAFPDAVEAFDVEALVDLAQRTGAGHVLFQATHAKHWLPGPNPEVDRILPGRTCERDLIMEIADALAAVGVPLIVYYHHGTDLKTRGVNEDDEEWAEAVGAYREDQTAYYDNYCRVLGWMGEHYGPKIMAWWFDAGYGLQFRPPAEPTPWERMTAAAKAGFPDRLVTYNPGIAKYTLYTLCQDYWAGEINGLDFRPSGPLTPTGLPWYSFMTWVQQPGTPWGVWGIDMESRDVVWPAPDPDAVAAYLEAFWACGGAVTFNLLCYQDGSVMEGHAEVLEEMRRRYR
jgi:hypothetical protein